MRCLESCAYATSHCVQHDSSTGRSAQLALSGFPVWTLVQLCTHTSCKLTRLQLSPAYNALGSGRRHRAPLADPSTCCRISVQHRLQTNSGVAKSSGHFCIHPLPAGSSLPRCTSQNGVYPPSCSTLCATCAAAWIHLDPGPRPPRTNLRSP